MQEAPPVQVPQDCVVGAVDAGGQGLGSQGGREQQQKHFAERKTHDPLIQAPCGSHATGSRSLK